MSAFRVILFSLIWSIAMPLQGSTPPVTQKRQILSAKVIVKFAVGTQAREVYAMALAGDPESDARLAALAARLSDELEMPVKVDRITSGQEFVISVDTDALVARLVENLQSRADVSQASVLERGGEPVRLYSNPGVMVDLRPRSSIYEAVTGNPLKSEERTAAAQTFANEVGNTLGLTLVARAQQTLELTIDMRAVTVGLVERLKQRSDVEYAQANLLMQPFDGAVETSPP